MVGYDSNYVLQVSQVSFKLCHHIHDAGDRVKLVRVGWLEILFQRPLAQPAKNGEIIHLVPWQHRARVIALVQQDRGSIHDVIRISRLVVFTLQHLNARAIVRSEPEVIGLVMSGFIRQAIGVVLV